MKYLNTFFWACLLIFLSFSSCDFTDPSDLVNHESSTNPIAPIIDYGDGQLIPNEYIVVFADQSITHPTLTYFPNDVRDQAQTSVENRSKIRNTKGMAERETVMRQEISPLLQRHNLTESAVKTVFSGRIKGAVMQLTPDQATNMQEEIQVQLIEQDRIISLQISPFINSPFMPSQVGQAGQLTPYGVDRVGGSIDFSGSPYYQQRWAWVIDTGVDMNHPDLNVDPFYSINFTPDADMDDGHGHGSHVAGIIAANNNGAGVQGVAAGAVIVNVKVLQNNGIGRVSDVVAGLDYAGLYAYPQDVINVSLGGGTSNAVDNSILGIANKGIKVVVAAGNDTQLVQQTSPARVNHPNVYTVSAIDQNDMIAGFSNYGAGVDYAAPGVDILSTFKDGGYAYVSGTSMAAPHMTGVLIVAGSQFTTDGMASPDPEGNYRAIISH